VTHGMGQRLLSGASRTLSARLPLLVERVAQTPREIVAAQALKHAQDAPGRPSTGGPELGRTEPRLYF
jgi:hypothetical protein